MNSKQNTHKEYKLEIIQDWASGDKLWVHDFIIILVQELHIKINVIHSLLKKCNSKEFAFELHQLSSQLALLGNPEINKLVYTIEISKEKHKLQNEIELLILKTRNVINQLKADFEGSDFF